MRLSCIVLLLIITTVAGRFGFSRSFGSSSRSFGSSSRSFGSSSRSFGRSSHNYPASHGYSGHGSGGAHTYPASPGLSGTHVRQTPHTVINHHYYSPPQQINYGSTFHPVYQGHPPVYVYAYRDSGSRFDNLLTGLALYNLGRNSRSHSYSSDRQYSSNPGEICKLGISKRSGEYEETRIDCNLMSSFIWEDTTSAARSEQRVVKNTTAVTVTQTVNGTGNSPVTTVTVTSNTVEDALKVKGPSIAVTPGMTCYMIRTVGAITALRKPVDCGLLQEYSRSSLHRSVAQCLMPLKMIIFYFSIILCLVRY